MTRFLPIVAVGVVLAGCVVGPDYRPPPPLKDASGKLVELNTAIETPTEGDDAWWRLYDDPALDKLILEAFSANADLAAAEANLTAARAIWQGARANLYPGTTLKADGIYGRDPTFDLILEVDGHKPKSDWTIDALVDVSYEVDLFGRVHRLIEASQANSEAAAAVRDGLKVTVAAETARAYGEYCALGEEIAVAQRIVSLTSREADIAVDRQRAGAGSDLDVARAQGLVAQVNATIPPLEGQRRAALYQLAALLGRTPADAPAEIEACATPPHLVSLIPVGDGAALLRRRPDIRAADRRLASAIAQVGVATADLYPRISLTGFWGGATDKIDQLATYNALAWGMGPSVSWAFPNQAGPRARIRQAEANAQGSLATFDSAVLQALKETAQALSGYAAELGHRAALVGFQEKEHQAYDLAHNQFVAGLVSNLDLLTTEQAMVAADSAVAASDAAIVQNQIAVFKALGGGWKTGTPIAVETRGR